MRITAMLAFFLALLTILPVYGASWGSYTVIEEIPIDYTRFSTTAKTWYPLSKTYTLPVIIGIQANTSFNPSAAEKKFIISIAGQTTSTFLDLAFFDTGVIDIVRTTQSGAVKIADTAFSGKRWMDFQFIIVRINSTTLTVEGNDGTVLASVSDSTLREISQIGASGFTNAVTSGVVYVAVLNPPFNVVEAVSSTTSSMIPLMLTIVAIAIPLIFLKYILKFLGRVLDKM